MLRINGKDLSRYIGMTVAQMLEEEAYNPAQVAVERNEEILPKGTYQDTVLAEGDVVEIVSFMGGGAANKSGR